MSRRLTGEERELWDRFRRSIRPLRKTRQADKKPEQATATVPVATPPARAMAPATREHTRQPALPPLVSLEERARRRLSRGLAALDARIDLHGMQQERAFAALTSFLRHAQRRGDRVVLVITGRGRDGEEGRGVLRRAVPAWLSQPEFRNIVVGFEEAGRRHGGAGALYVQIRRRRESRRAER
jgi:DNA-nicking Smr family endonuclease